MLGLRLFTSLLAATVAFALPTNVTDLQAHDCGTDFSDEAIIAAEAHFAANKVAPKLDVRAVSANIPVYWHVIQSGNALNQGNIPHKQIVDSIAQFNRDYAAAGLSFTLAGVDRSLKPAWFNVVKQTTAETQMKSTLRKGGVNSLNIYTVGSIQSSANSDKKVVGYATFPYSYKDQPKLDGVVILYDTAPGSYLGKTPTHEFGHWAGLYHTFQGGCEGLGDHVADTPAEAEPSYTCDQVRDTCPGGGVDPIRNYMDYSKGPCRSQLTKGQINRMRDQLRTYRGIIT